MQIGYTYTDMIFNTVLRLAGEIYPRQGLVKLIYLFVRLLSSEAVKLMFLKPVKQRRWC